MDDCKGELYFLGRTKYTHSCHIDRIYTDKMVKYTEIPEKTIGKKQENEYIWGIWKEKRLKVG